MNWEITIPGQPLTVNHAYRPTVTHLRGGRTVASIAKADGVEAYQVAITRIAAAARPSSFFVTEGTFVRMKFWYYLNPDLDCDNVKKLVIDAICLAIPSRAHFALPETAKPLNDRWVLTTDMHKIKVPKGQQHMMVEIDLD